MAQAQTGRISTLKIDAEDLVHPSQVFCQYAEFKRQRHYVPPEGNNLPMLPYLFYLGGDAETLRNDTEAMGSCAVGQAVLFGKPLDVSRLSHSHVGWLETQARRVEEVVAGEMRPDVQAYFNALRRQVPGNHGEGDGSTNVQGPAGAPRDVAADMASNSGSSSSPGTATIATPPDTRQAVDIAPQHTRINVHGVKFDAITEAHCNRHVMDALEAGRGGWIITSNLDHVRRAQGDKEFQAMLSEADLVVADGMPLIWASRLQGTPLPERVAGSSMVSTLAESAAQCERSLFMLGGEPGTAEEAADVLTGRYRGLRIAGHYCPPVGFEADEDEMRCVQAALREAQPDIVYVALGSPKQERLIRKLRLEMPEVWWIGVGISLSFLCGRVKRAPRWMQRLGLEWVHRLVQEPRRLARRYLHEGLPFACRLLVRAMIHRWSASPAGQSAGPSAPVRPHEQTH